MTLPPPRWSHDEAEEILRRAVELHLEEGASNDGAIDDDDLERLGVEAGVSSVALQRAIAEMRVRKLATPSQAADRLDRWFGPRWFVAVRSVPGPRRDVADVVAKTMQQQLFRVQRNFGNTVVFVSGSAWMEPVRRALGVEPKDYVPRAEVVMITVTNTARRPQWVDVRIEAGTPGSRRQRVQSAAVGLGLSAATSALLAALLGPLSWPLVLGSLVAGGAHGHTQREAYRQDLRGLRANMERFLDYLEHERVS